MSDSNPDLSMSDEASIGHVAQDAADRRLALAACLIVWNKEDIRVLERVDCSAPPWHGWTLRRRKQ